MDFLADSYFFYVIAIREGSLVFGTFGLDQKPQQHAVYYFQRRKNVCYLLSAALQLIICILKYFLIKHRTIERTLIIQSTL